MADAPTVVEASTTASFLLRCSRAPNRFFYPCNAKARQRRPCTYRLRQAGEPAIEVFVDECDYREGGTGWRVWPCALLLACWLSAHHEELDLGGSRVIELGAGLGLPGLTAAALGAQLVRITDCLPRLLHTVRRSAEVAAATVRGVAAARPTIPAAANSGSAMDHASTPQQPGAVCAALADVSAALLDWDDVMAPEAGEVFSTEQGVKLEQRAQGAAGISLADETGISSLDPSLRFELLLASDVVYSRSHARQLPAVLAARASASGALACLMVPVRSDEHTRCFLASLVEHGFAVRLARVTKPWVEAVVSTQMGEADGDAPPDAHGWIEHTATNGRIFYHSARAGKSVWRRPSEMDVQLPQRGAARPNTRASEPYSGELELAEGDILFVEAEMCAAARH